MNKVQIAEGLYWVGIIDWNLRDFHGFNVPNGGSYNAYLIIDDKVTLIDTVKAMYAEEFLNKISEIIDPAKIDYIIANHVEQDHSGSLPRIMEKAPQAKIFCTAKGKEGFIKHYKHPEWDFQVVQEGDSIDTGRRKLMFIPMPMLHWPDSMATYDVNDCILFSNDAFGQQLASAQRFDDQVDFSLLMHENARYFANILMPFTSLISKAVNKVAGLPEVKLIAPSHGVIWRSHIPDIVEAYAAWGRGDAKAKIVVAYDTMWGSTDAMARTIAEGVTLAGTEVKLMRLKENSPGDVVTELLTAKGIMIGSPTLNNGVLASVGGLLAYLKGLRPIKKIGAAFGAYGWGGGAQKTIEQGLTQAGIALETSNLTFKYILEDEEYAQCREFGLQFGRQIKKG